MSITSKPPLPGHDNRLPVRESYDLWAESYDSAPNPVLALEQRCLEPMLPSLAGKTVADLGCGTGRWLVRIAASDVEAYVGIDLSGGMLRSAARKSGLASHLVQADCLALPLRSASVDVVLCSLLAGYVDLVRLAAEVARIVSDRGDVFVSEFHPDASASGWKRSFRADGRTVELPAAPCDPNEVETVFRRQGFGVVARDEISFGEPERRYFFAGGKEAEFESLKQVRALFISHLRKTATSLIDALPRESPDRVRALQPQKLILRGARVAVNAESALGADLEIECGRICRVVSRQPGREVRVDDTTRCLDLSGYLLLPGLINAHDHLEFNLFPRLGRGPYASAQRWARDIYHPASSPVREHLQVPKDVRLRWGGVKNLLSGVTTVCHHNPFQAEVFSDNFPVRVLSRYSWSHSLAFDNLDQAASDSDVGPLPFIIHLGEGTDAVSRDEIFELDRRGLLGPNTVIVHGVALNDAGHQLLARRGAALIWCPTSNLFTLGKTLGSRHIGKNPHIALGSDSALTAGDLMGEIRIACELGAAPEQIYAMVTTQAASILKLSDGEGTLDAGAVADVVAIPDNNCTPARALSDATANQIAMVLLGGVPQLLAPELHLFPKDSIDALSRVCIDGAEKFVRAPIPQLLAEARKPLGDNLRLAGKALSA